jgi:release factor glutamine methyltransferase
MTVAEALARAEARLTEAGIDSAALDAELLLRHATGWDGARVIADGPRPLPAEAEPVFNRLVESRAARRPLQHLTGRRCFWRQELFVTPDVLVPRPETELLVEAALDVIRDVARPIVVDVGTGSGCIAFALAAERPDALVHATDISSPALAVARENARRLGLEDRVCFHQGDLLEPLLPLAGRLALVACNPPYVGRDEKDSLAPEVRDHEPEIALFPPSDDRLSIYRRLGPEAERALRPGAALVVEVGAGMAEDVARVLQASGLSMRRVLTDLTGIPRTLVAVRPLE